MDEWKAYLNAFLTQLSKQDLGDDIFFSNEEPTLSIYGSVKNFKDVGAKNFINTAGILVQGQLQ